MPDIPTNNIELYLANIAGESEQMPDFPTNKIERYLAKIAENGGGGGGGGESNAVKYTAQTLTAAQQTQARENIGADGKPAEVTVSTDDAVTQALDAEKIYHFTGALTALTITLNAAATGQLAQYHFDFDSGSTAPTLTLPNTVTMPGGFTVEASKHYEIDILNSYGAVMAW